MLTSTIGRPKFSSNFFTFFAELSVSRCWLSVIETQHFQTDLDSSAACVGQSVDTGLLGTVRIGCQHSALIHSWCDETFAAIGKDWEVDARIFGTCASLFPVPLVEKVDVLSSVHVF